MEVLTEYWTLTSSRTVFRFDALFIVSLPVFITKGQTMASILPASHSQKQMTEVDTIYHEEAAAKQSDRTSGAG